MPQRGSTWRQLLGLLCLSLYWRASTAGYLEDNFPANSIEDASLTTLQLLAKYKYPAERHSVTTEDKYVLQMHRIARPGAKPVLLMHGLQDSSSTWIIMGPQSGLGYFLYDAGYDVWMGNARGNRYSRSHVKLNPSTDKVYWSFSWHEIGLYDLPAMIDAVLAKTGYKKLSYIGHSQGTTSFFVMASSRTDYNEKVLVMQALAPVAFTTHIKTPLRNLASSSLNILGENYEVLPHSDLALTQCMSSAIRLQTCLYYIGLILGKNPAEVNRTMLPVILGQLPAGSSAKQFKHYLQLHESDRFCQYDFGKVNQRIYGRSTPPDYALERITAPVGLYYAQNDFLAAVEDVHRLAKRLPNVVVNHMYPNKKFNHVDMVWGISSRRIAQPKFLEVMQLWEAGGPQNLTSPDGVSTPSVKILDEEQKEDQEAMENYVK
ncbi:lipase 1 [Drosophila innubila]|uniref:lipase 1 n=1 Tax=Drosophila innubila TaxID=198719 RepID=UPI00148E322F|nr:lipase 1 [Drosophila innubila]